MMISPCDPAGHTVGRAAMVIRSFQDVIDACGQASVLARLLNLRVSTVQKWRDRDSIPVEHWKAIIEVARRKNRKITVDQLMILAAKRAPALNSNTNVVKRKRYELVPGGNRKTEAAK